MKRGWGKTNGKEKPRESYSQLNLCLIVFRLSHVRRLEYEFEVRYELRNFCKRTMEGWYRLFVVGADRGHVYDTRERETVRLAHVANGQTYKTLE